MNNKAYLQTGKVFFAVALIAIGIIHFITGTFPSRLLPVASAYPGKIVLVYLNGIALIAAGALIMAKKYAYPGACLAAAIWLIWLLALHLPQLLLTYNKPFEWTPTFEVALFFGGALVLMGLVNPVMNNRFKLTLAGSFIVGVAILVFAILHLIYLQFITTLIPLWIPGKLFWAYLVMVAFFAVAISLFIRAWVRLSATLLALMFFIWFLILHIPLVISLYKVEAEWTSLFVVLASSGVALLIVASTNKRARY